MLAILLTLSLLFRAVLSTSAPDSHRDDVLARLRKEHLADQASGKTTLQVHSASIKPHSSKSGADNNHLVGNWSRHEYVGESGRDSGASITLNASDKDETQMSARHQVDVRAAAAESQKNQVMLCASGCLRIVLCTHYVYSACRAD